MSSKVEETLQTPSEYDQYMDELQEFEDDKAKDNDKSNEKKDKRRKMGDTMDKSLSAGQESGLRMEQLQGYFWPMDVYKRVKGQTPEKSLPIRAQAEQDLEPDLKHKKSKSKIRSKVWKSKV